jgi:hypothetical protein
LTNRHLANKHLDDRHLADGRLADRHLDDRHLADRHLADRHLADKHLANSIEKVLLTMKHLTELHGQYFVDQTNIMSFNQIVFDHKTWKVLAGNTKGGRITVPSTSCLTGLKSVV